MCECGASLSCSQWIFVAGEVGCVDVVVFGEFVFDKKRIRLALVGPGAGVGEGLCVLILMELTYCC